MKKLVVLAAYTRSLITFRLPLMKAFLAKGWEVVALGPGEEAEWAPRFAPHGVRFRSVPLERNGLNPFADWKTCRALEHIFREEAPELLFCTQAKAVVYGLPAAHRAGIPRRFALVAGLGSIFRGTGLKNALLRRVLSFQYRRALKHAQGVLFQNPDDRNTFLALGLVPPEKIHMIPGSGVDLERFTPLPLPQQPVFLLVARLLKDKGIREYLLAAREVKRTLPQCRFLLVGPFDSNPTALTPQELRPFQEEGTVEYWGEQEDVRPALAQASVFVLPSYHEGTPMSVLEAMACGRPVITTNAPGCRETVVPEKNGLLVPPRKVSPLQKAMETLAQDPERRQRMGQESLRLARERFSATLVTGMLLDILGE